MSKIAKLQEKIRELVKKELEEATTTGDIAGYETPHAFTGGPGKGKKKKKEISTNSTGYSIVKESFVRVLERTYGQHLAKQGKKLKVTFVNGKPILKVIPVDPEPVNEDDLGLTYKKGKTVKVKHKTSGKSIVIVDKPNVRKEYEKIGFYAESINESDVFTPSMVKKAIEIAKSMSGNMTGAVKKIEKIHRLLSKNREVADALRIANENEDEWKGIGYDSFESVDEAKLKLTKDKPKKITNHIWSAPKRILTKREWLRIPDMRKIRKNGVDYVATSIGPNRTEVFIPVVFESVNESRYAGNLRHATGTGIRKADKVAYDKILNKIWKKFVNLGGGFVEFSSEEGGRGKHYALKFQVARISKKRGKFRDWLYLAIDTKTGNITARPKGGNPLGVIGNIKNPNKVAQALKDWSDEDLVFESVPHIDEKVIKTMNEGRYHDYRNDESLSPKQKIGRSMREVRDGLNNLENLVKMNVKLKNELNVNSQSYWKNTHLKIKRNPIWTLFSVSLHC